VLQTTKLNVENFAAYIYKNNATNHKHITENVRNNAILYILQLYYNTANAAKINQLTSSSSSETFVVRHLQIK